MKKNIFKGRFIDLKRVDFRAPDCAEYDENIDFSCDDQAVEGVKDKAVAINFSHIEAATITRAGGNPQIVNNIVLAGSDTGFLWEGTNNSHQPSSKFVKKTYRGVYDHVFKFEVFTKSPATKKQAELIMKGRSTVITEGYQRNTAGDGAFDIWGLDVGMVGLELIFDPNGADNPGFSITLGSPEKIKEPHLPSTLFAASGGYAATKVIFDGLYTP